MWKRLGLGGLVAVSVTLFPGTARGQDPDATLPCSPITDQGSLPCSAARAMMRAFAPFGPDAQSQPPPPSPNPAPPSLPDLFPPSQTQGNAQAQARLDKRSQMLKIHQRLGLITTIPLLATVISGSFAGGKHPNASDRDIHAGLGAATAGLYFSTAYFSIFAPRIPGTKTRGPIRLHKALAWIHGPGMILTPILGVMAFDQLNKGEKVHGIAKAHGAVGYVTAAAYGAAIVSVSFRF